MNELNTPEIESEIEISSPQFELSNYTIVSGPPITPEQRITLYSSAEFEQLIKEWAFGYLKHHARSYKSVKKIGGSGDKGRDICGYYEGGEWDNYQCKHYKDPLAPSDIWIELAKHIYYTFRGDYARAKKYYFVSPRDCGPKLDQLLRKPEELKKELIRNWDEYCKNKLINKVQVDLSGGLLSHLNNFDFSIFGSLEIQEVISQLRHTIYYAPRFGGGLVKKHLSPEIVQGEFQPSEINYIRNLKDAYSDREKRDLTFDDIHSIEQYREHIRIQRLHFFEAETLKANARDSLPQNGKYDDLLEMFYEGICDILWKDYPDGFDRLSAVLLSAKGLQVVSHPLSAHLDVRERGGICHQLSNQQRIKWLK